MKSAALDCGIGNHAAPRLPAYQGSSVSTMTQLLAGGVAGAIGKTCTAPLGRLTILFQVQGMHTDVETMHRNSLWKETTRIAREEGLQAFWKGNLVTVAHRLPYSATSFLMFEHFKNIMHSIPGFESRGKNNSADFLVRFVGGGLAGIAAASLTYPLDLVKARLTVQTNVIYYKGISDALYVIYRDEGVKGLYKGLGPTLLGVGPSLAISFSVYETLRSWWKSKRSHDPDALMSLGCGSLSGFVSSTATFPLDLVRRRMQLEGSGGRAQVYKTGLVGTLRHIIQNEGYRGLYRGILPEYYKVVPSVGIMFMAYEAIKHLLCSDMSSD